MQKLLKKYSFYLLLGLLMSPAELSAEVPLKTVKKRVVKTYTGLKNERVIINNQYGDVVAKTWHQPKILIVVTLTAHAKTITAANKLLGRINIAADRNENQVAVTSIITKAIKPLPAGLVLQKRAPVTDTTRNAKLLSKEGCNIRYEIFLPSGTALSILNRFGDITVGDYNGSIALENKFGNIKAGNLAGLSKLTLEQGDITLKHASYADIKAKAFGSIKIESAGEKISGSFSSGNRLDIGFTNRADSIIIDADNVQEINLSGIAATNANYNIKTILSKLLNKSTLALKELGNNERKPQSKTGVDSLAMLLKSKTVPQNGSEKNLELQKKKLQVTLISQLKKLREYEGTTGSGKGKINVKVAFSVLNILN